MKCGLKFDSEESTDTPKLTNDCEECIIKDQCGIKIWRDYFDKLILPKKSKGD